jgi:two-component system response regulator FixJ
MPDSPTVYVVDDDAASRDSLTFLLRTAKLRVLAFESADHFVKAKADVAGCCVVTDIRMPGMTGLDLLKQLRKEGRSVPVIVMTGHGDVPLAVEAMKHGATDFLEKPFDDERMLAAIRTALSQQKSDIKSEAERAEILDKLATLSARERQVLDGLIAGSPNKTIAYDLQISPRTVEIYRANVMTKMNANSLSELVRMALSADVLR